MLCHACKIGFRHLDEVTKHRIVADLERFDSGRGDLALLKLADPIFSLARRVSELIKIDIVTIAENSAFFQRERRIVRQRFAQFISQRGHLLDLVLQTLRQKFEVVWLIGSISSESEGRWLI